MSGDRDDPAGAGGVAERRTLLASVYGPQVAGPLSEAVERRLRSAASRTRPRARWSERDVWLITYPDQFTAPGEPPLRTLGRVADRHLRPWMNGLHLTPFYPWTSDEGYSVVDYLAVDERYGGWADVAALGARYRLMLDAVVNHLSSRSPWFLGFLSGDEAYRGFFRTADPNADLSSTARPRASPLLTRFDAVDGPRWVWTTFSADQVDLDYANPRVLLAVLDVLLAYVDRGADALRLDAIAYLWKQEGTSSIHLPQTHALVQLLRSAVAAAHPEVLLVTETNVPHAENVAYFGTVSQPGAHAVYQFALPPVTLHALLAGDARTLRDWAHTAVPPRADTTFLNFLASHDGVGLRPVEGLLDDDELSLLADATRACGGQVSMRTMADGSHSPYELNATWFALLGHGADEDTALARHLAAHAIMLSLRGLPLIYVHSLFGTGNDQEGYARTGQARSLNRTKLTAADVETRLGDPGTRAARSWTGLRAMIGWRTAWPAFHPDSAQQVLHTDARVFAVERVAGGGERARVYVNVANEPVTITDADLARWAPIDDGAPPGAELRLEPYGCRWLRLA